MFDRLKDAFKPNANPVSYGGNIRVLGDRASGKTTYIAALARWPNATTDSFVESVTAITDETDELIQKARDILEQGLQFEPTRLTDVYDIQEFSLRILLKSEFMWTSPRGAQREINLYSKDFPGEFLDELVKGTSPQVEDYIEDCAQGSSIMFLVDGNAYKRDRVCAQAITRVLRTLDQYPQDEVRRFAFAINKCEQPEFWVNRQKPEVILRNRFPQTLAALNQWRANKGGEVELFTLSAFGMTGSAAPRPNFKKVESGAGGTRAILRDPRFWKPFGLVSPIYWLATGKRHPKIDKE